MVIKRYELYNGKSVAPILVEEHEETSEEKHIRIQGDIEVLELTQTPRRIRDALSSKEGLAWLDNLGRQIASLRKKLA